MMRGVSFLHKYIYLISLLMLVSTGCVDRNCVYNEYIALPNVGWNSDSLAVFYPDQIDKGQRYDVLLQLRTQNSYPYSNLWLFVDIEAPDGHVVRDTIECMLAEPNGKWLGDGWGSLYSIQIPLMRDVAFKEPGRYGYRFSQAMRDSSIIGVHSIGLKIDKVSQ
ncbi:MAG: gliding motility lipoprotein GldH [Marinilabiliaceae bacterium]|nr:gliding motility lipoprotein GldH [Marinilabiliaceae bacterium]